MHVKVENIPTFEVSGLGKADQQTYLTHKATFIMT